MCVYAILYCEYMCLYYIILWKYMFILYYNIFMFIVYYNNTLYESHNYVWKMYLILINWYFKNRII